MTKMYVHKCDTCGDTKHASTRKQFGLPDGESMCDGGCTYRPTGDTVDVEYNAAHFMGNVEQSNDNTTVDGAE